MRTLSKPASLKTFFSLFGPAWAPRHKATSCALEVGTHINVEKLYIRFETYKVSKESESILAIEPFFPKIAKFVII